MRGEVPDFQVLMFMQGWKGRKVCMETFYKMEGLVGLGIKPFGENVFIGKNVVLYSPKKLTIYGSMEY